METTTTPTLTLCGVTRTFPSGDTRLTALDQVDFDCPAGSWTAIMGPSGSGKSTLLNCAAGLDRPDTGQVLLGGQDLARCSDDQLAVLRRADIGFIFQQFNLVPALTASQNVALPLKLSQVPAADELALTALAAVGLADHVHHKPRQLSGGQQQRVAIARVLAVKPQILFADEPTGALDSSSARNVLKLFRELVDTHGQTILMVTHDPTAAACADSVTFLFDGRIISSLAGASPSQIADTLTQLEVEQ